MVKPTVGINNNEIFKLLRVAACALTSKTSQRNKSMSQQITTATTTHNLLKYSKSFGANDKASEWQHYTNPVIKSILDVQKSSSGDFTLFKLRIIWVMSKGPELMSMDSQEVTFVSLNVLKRA